MRRRQAPLLRPDGGFTLRPFVYGLRREQDARHAALYLLMRTRRAYYPLSLFVHGDPYKLWGLCKTDMHLIGVEGLTSEASDASDATFSILGRDRLGRDMLSRVVYGHAHLHVHRLGRRGAEPDRWASC